MDLAPNDPLLGVLAPPRVARFREVLRRRQWDAYAHARGLSDELGACFGAFWAVVHALRWPESVFAGRDVTGSREEALATARRALADLS